MKPTEDFRKMERIETKLAKGMDLGNEDARDLLRMLREAQAGRRAWIEASKTNAEVVAILFARKIKLSAKVRELEEKIARMGTDSGALTE